MTQMRIKTVISKELFNKAKSRRALRLRAPTEADEP